MDRKYKNPPLSFQCPPGIREQLEKLSKLNDRSISKIIVYLLNEALEKQKNEPKQANKKYTLYNIPSEYEEDDE